MKGQWIQPKVLSVSALPVGLGDCYVGQTQTDTSCETGGQTGSGTIPNAHLCANGGYALPDGWGSGCQAGGTPLI